VPYNTTVDELIKTTNKNYYSKFKVEVHTDQHRTKFTFTEKLRAQVTSLLSRLHQEYFPNEPSPFGSKTNTPRFTINNQNHQEQSQQQTMTVTLLELQSKIDQKLAKTTDEKEKSFLQKIKDQLPTVISVAQLIQLILTITHQTGLDPQIARDLLA
jgi:septin family protein